VGARRRLSAEELRDAMLQASGELNLARGGPPVRPEINREAGEQPRQVMGTFAEAWRPSRRPEDRHRRSLYVLKLRGLRDPMAEVLDAPPADLSCERRGTSTAAPQALALFNGSWTYGRALAVAARVRGETSEERAAVVGVFERCLGRAPSAEEIAAATEHVRAMTERHEGMTFGPVERPGEIVRQAVEENTGEPFTFRERLDRPGRFIPDLEPERADAATRGLAELALVLLNTNELAYVD
jgi:hypothetical protein